MDTANRDEMSRLTSELKDGDNGRSLAVNNVIAKGGMGVVYSVTDRSIRRGVAMKVLHDHLANDAGQCRAFIEEARITGQLEHPNIVPVHSLGINDDGKPFFTMKYVEGDPLSDIIEHIKSGDPAFTEYYTHFKILSVFRKVLDAVSYAHARGIVHRDIKPANIMIGAYGEVMLMDWGIAKVLNGPEEVVTDSTVSYRPDRLDETLAGLVKGSPAYMSPEQSMGDSSLYDRRSDIFLLGATLYHLMTLKPPYDGVSLETMIYMAEHCQFVPPQEAGADRMLPEELCMIISKAMSAEKERRYQTVEELATAIDRLMSGQAISQKHQFKSGEDIIRHGDTGHEAYVIIEGEVEVHKRIGGKKTVFTRLHRGDVFGEMALISDELRSATVTALVDTTCMVITPETLQQQMNLIPPWFGKIVTALTKRLRAMDNLVHPLLASDCTFEVCNQARLYSIAHGTINAHRQVEVALADLVYEISNNLKVPEERIRPILAGLVEIGLCSITDKLSLVFKNYNLFCDFSDFCKNAPRLANTSTRAISTVDVHRVYTDGISVVHRHLRTVPSEAVPAFGQLRPVRDEMPQEEADAFRRDFRQRLEIVQQYASKAEQTQRAYFNTKIRKVQLAPSAPKPQQPS